MVPVLSLIMKEAFVVLAWAGMAWEKEKMGWAGEEEGRGGRLGIRQEKKRQGDGSYRHGAHGRGKKRLSPA